MRAASGLLFCHRFADKLSEPGVQGLNDAFRSSIARSRLVEDIRIEGLLDAHPNGPKSRENSDLPAMLRGYLR